MPNVTIYKTNGSEAGQIMLNDDIFGIEVNEAALHEVVVAQLANRRQGTQSAKSRGEVRGGGIKPWRQKGTGRARQGSIRAPQWKGGGVVFAPKPRDYSKKVNKQIKYLAMASALSAKVASGELVVLEDVELAAPKTKEVVAIMKNLGLEGKVLFVTAAKDETFLRASRNIEAVKTSNTGEMNVYDILNCNKIVLTVDAVKKVEEVYA
ncbi:MAG: 50S ribosomal protein L4 [Clostridiales bacterium]|nr:50S ribosomal protein L4 [Clostridiales bacterium]MBR3843485.1 50S ribosomal protein L4 [Christensenellaceae bacterium]